MPKFALLWLLSLEIAIEKIRQVLFEQKFNEEMAIVNKSRKSQIGNMDRNEKIRTYNYTRNMITDHRINMSKVVQSIPGFFKVRKAPKRF